MKKGILQKFKGEGSKDKQEKKDKKEKKINDTIQPLPEDSMKKGILQKFKGGGSKDKQEKKVNDTIQPLPEDSMKKRILQKFKGGGSKDKQEKKINDTIQSHTKDSMKKEILQKFKGRIFKDKQEKKINDTIQPHPKNSMKKEILQKFKGKIFKDKQEKKINDTIQSHPKDSMKKEILRKFKGRIFKDKQEKKTNDTIQSHTKDSMKKEFLRKFKGRIFKDKPEKNNKQGKKKHSIMQTLILNSLLPVVLMIILGIISYQTASTSIISKYTESAMSTVSAVCEYCDMVCDSISTKAIELVTNSGIGDYYDKEYKNKDKNVSASAFRNAKDVISSAVSANDNIFSCSVISEEASHASSLKGALSEVSYSKFLETAEGKIFGEDKKARNQWLGYHSFLDNNTNSTPDKYAIAYYQKTPKTNSYLVMDVNMEVAVNMLNQMDFGDGSIKALVSPDGREVVAIQGSDEIKKETEEKLEQPYFVGYDLGTSEDEEGTYSENISINGESYLYISAPVGETGIMICSLIPRSNLLGQVENIKYITIGVVILAAFLALFIGFYISSGISKTVKNMSSGLAAVAEGDLTTSFTTKRKDEFSILTGSLNSMLSNMCVLMQDMKQFSAKVNNLSGEVSNKTADLNVYMQSVATSMNEVSLGVQNQAQDIEASNLKMMDFSVTINSVTEKTNNMSSAADKAIEAVEQGKVIVQQISEQSDATVQLTKILVEDINAVHKNSEEIKGFANVINDIARQTNLLSLNASIEAVRAGEKGKGFAVVAEEIRNLADQSGESAKRINDILEKIAETTYKTADSAQRAESMVNQQADSLNDTVVVFGMIHKCVGNMVDDIRLVVESLEQIILEKDQISDSFQSISAVSEEVAASAEEVSSTLTGQVSDVSNLNEEIEKLRSDVSELDKSIDKFKI